MFSITRTQAATIKPNALQTKNKQAQAKQPQTPKLTQEEALRRILEARAAQPQQPEKVHLGMGDHTFWSNPDSYRKMSDSNWWANPQSYMGHGR